MGSKNDGFCVFGPRVSIKPAMTSSLMLSLGEVLICTWEEGIAVSKLDGTGLLSRCSSNPRAEGSRRVGGAVDKTVEAAAVAMLIVRVGAASNWLAIMLGPDTVVLVAETVFSVGCVNETVGEGATISIATECGEGATGSLFIEGVAVASWPESLDPVSMVVKEGTRASCGAGVLEVLCTVMPR
jgi:hypothetical protein